MKTISNTDFALVVSKANPSFRDIFSKLSSDYVKTHGFDVSTATDIPREKLYEFIGLSLRVAFAGVDVSQVRDPFTEGDLGIQYNEVMGAILQKVSVNPIKENSPLFMNLKSGQGIDMERVSKPDVQSRYFEQNDNFQASITVQDNGFLQQVFLNPNGISELISGIMQQLNNSYAIHKVTLKLEALNNFVNSAKFPLKPTQIVDLSLSDTPTNDELVNAILAIRKTITLMSSSIRTGIFNGYGFQSTQKKEDLRLLVRQGYKDDIAVKTMTGAFNPEQLSLGIPIIELPNFGGIEYYKEKELKTKLVEKYDDDGKMLGYFDPSASKTIIKREDAFEKDPNKDTYAILVDKHALVMNDQMPLTITPAPYNPAGMYTTYWINKPNGTVRFDSLRNLVVFKTPLA